MKKIITIVGARPQFIKLAAVSRILRSRFTEVIIHTGQHYDYNMSDLFFEELEIPKPDYNLGISNGSHGKMTGEMLGKIEEVLIKEMPDLVLVYGDTNSTLAGALAAVKLQIPICHVEAGGRLGSLNNPEEVNRIVTDHISSLLLGCTDSAMEYLKKEGLESKSVLTGDPMYDAFLFYGEKSKNQGKKTLKTLSGDECSIPTGFYYMTCHRQENTEKDETLAEILNAVNDLDETCIYPVHPRNRQTVLDLQSRYKFDNLILCEPVGYLTSVYLTNHAKKIITDSGGLQREAYFAHKQCVTVFDYVAWPETMTVNRNQLSKPIKQEILSKLSVPVEFDNDQPFGNGHAAEKIVDEIEKFMCNFENGV